MESLFFTWNSTNETQELFVEPPPVQSYLAGDKFTFQQRETARDQNRPASTRLLEALLVIGFLSLFLIFCLIYARCCSSEVRLSKREQYALRNRDWMPVPQIANGVGGGPDAGISTFIPTTGSKELPPMYMKRSGINKCAKPACVCAPGGSNSQRTKGWRRNFDDESYGPSQV